MEHKNVKCFLCFFLFENAEVKIHLCYNAVKHGVLASFKTLLENKLELGENGFNLYAYPRYSLDSATCMPLLKITGSVIELCNFRSQFLHNRLLVSQLAAIYGKNSYGLPTVGIQFLLQKKSLPDFLDQELQ